MINDAWKSADYQAEHFLWSVNDRVATVTLNRPERKNPLTFESYAELRDLSSAAYPTPTIATPSSSPAPAAISAQAATCTTSSGR